MPEGLDDVGTKLTQERRNSKLNFSILKQAGI